MVIFDDNEYKPSFWIKLKNLFLKKQKIEQMSTSFDHIDIEKCKTDLSNVVKDSDEFTKYEPLTDITKMALLREEFLKKKYHLIGSHNAMISALNDNITFIKTQLTLIRTRTSHLKVLSSYCNTTANSSTNDAREAITALITSMEKEEKACRNFIIRNQSKIQNRSILIGDLTRAKNMSELAAAEKEYKARSKQKPTRRTDDE